LSGTFATRKIMNITDLNRTIDDDSLYSLLRADHGDPFAVLGMHQIEDHLAVRIFRPDAQAVAVRAVGNPDKRFPAQRLHLDGFFER